MSLKKLVEEITNPILQEGVNDPGILKAIFLAGGPGSGKGYVSKGLFGIPDTTSVSAYGLKVVNQDKALTVLLKKYGFGTDLDKMPEELFRQLTDPTYSDYSGMRTYAQDITNQQKKLYMNGRLGMIIDGTGHKYGSIKKKKKELEDIGYDTYMVFVHTNLDIAQKRNMERDRKLNPELVETYWNDVQKNLISFQGLFGNTNFLMVDNSKTLSEKQATKKFNMLVTKGIGKFINNPVKNHLGKKWIEKQKIMKESVNEAIQPSKAYGFYKLEKGKKIIQFKGSKSAARSELKKAKKKDPKGKYQLIQTYKKDVGDIFEQKSKIKKTIGVFGGRFQPFHSGHLATYKWLAKQVDEAYITTTNIKKPPRHPMNFKEKVRHMTKMGIPTNRIIEEKIPYVANNLLKKFNTDTTAVVYAFGTKDAGRLKAGTKKSGGKTYYQDYKKNKNDIKGYEEHGYFITAPQFGNLSGTKTRDMLGNPNIDDKEKKKFFKKTFGYFDKGLYIMMVNKFKKLFEAYVSLLESATGDLQSVDDGPGFLQSLSAYKKRGESDAGKLGWEIVKNLIDDDVYNSQNTVFPKYGGDPDGPIGSVSYGPAGVGIPTPMNQDNFIGSELWNKWLTHIDKILSNQEYDYVDDLKQDRWFTMLDSEDTQDTLEDEIPEETDEDRGDEQHDDSEEVKEMFTKQWWKKLLTEGGAYGHMAHPFDDKDLTFKDLKNIIEMGLGGTLSREDNVTEKTDGQNLMISWKDGKLIAARNKGHIKNKGKTALSIKDVESKFKGRGEIRNAFVYAVRDLSKAIGALSDKQQNKVFGEGSKWMSLEVMWPASENVVNYDITEIVFHGAMEYDDSGKVIGQAKGSARMLQGMIKQVNQNIQKHYKISKPNFLTVPKHQDFGKLKGKFLGRLKTLQSHYGLKDNDTLSLYHQMFWQEWILNGANQTDFMNITNEILVKLTKRWAFFDKSYKISQIKKDLKEDHPEFLDWVLATDKYDHTKMVKDNMKPFEELFFDVGATILKNMDGWMAVNPAKSVQVMRKKLQSAIKNIRSGGDLKKLNKLKQQLDKLNSIGGLDAVVPTEGIVFKYNGKVYKFTGAFAPINQITGMMTF